MRLVNRAGLGAAELELLERDVLEHRSLIDAFRYCRTHVRDGVMPVVVVLDEYTHDVVFPWRDGRALVYGST